MKVILFQGNFPEKYNGTRHNISFAIADSLSLEHHASFSEKNKFKALTTEIECHGEKIILVKPLTYYNDTGYSANAICKFYKVDVKRDFLVVLDDIDLDFGVVRSRLSGGSAGNNGLKSIISVFGENFPRVKVGIKNEKLKLIGAQNFVLAKFSKEESLKINEVAQLAVLFINEFMSNQLKNEKRKI